MFVWLNRAVVVIPGSRLQFDPALTLATGWTPASSEEVAALCGLPDKFGKHFEQKVTNEPAVFKQKNRS